MFPNKITFHEVDTLEIIYVHVASYDQDFLVSLEGAMMK